jgi:hypothetical protein
LAPPPADPRRQPARRAGPNLLAVADLASAARGIVAPEFRLTFAARPSRPAGWATACSSPARPTREA